MRPGDRLDALLAGAAGLAGMLRGLALPAPTDETFHLVRVGTGLLAKGPASFADPPGGEGAPLLGALATVVGAAFAEGAEDLGRPAGAVLLGASAALLAWALSRLADRLVGALGAALLVAPPAFAAGFPARPDAALGGMLIAWALARTALGARPVTTLGLAWAAGLATPAAWPAAAWLQARLRGRELADWRSWIGLGTCASTVGALSLAIPEGHRGEIARGLATGLTLSGEGWGDSLAAVRELWLFGILLALPLALAGRGEPAVRRLVGPWAAAVLVTAALAEPGAFRGLVPALAPSTCLLLALLVHSVSGAGAGAGPRRGVLAAFAVPVALAVFGGKAVRSAALESREQSARSAQIAQFLREEFERSGAVLAERCGALAALAERTVLPLRSGRLSGAAGPGEDLPAAVVFSGAIRPDSRVERALFADPEFLRGYAPLLFRRGPTRGIQDALWVRRAAPREIDPLPPDYAPLLREGWRRYADRDLAAAQKSFQAASGHEPPELGVAHEWLGIVFEEEGEARAAEIVFADARSRDPAAARARAHLADRALSRGQLARADSLIAEAFAFTSHDADLWALRARLAALGGDPAGALGDSERAIYLDPRAPMLLANHGILLWTTGDAAAARDFWRLAARWDDRVLRYLGDFEKAEGDAPAPPLLPLFTLDSFRPPAELRPGRGPD